MKKICKECGELKEHQARGMCKTCYEKIRRKNNTAKCDICGHRRVLIKRMCKKCIDGKTEFIICLLCKNSLPKFSKGMCENCYKSEWSKTRKKEKCSGCSKLAIIHYRRNNQAYCLNCYNKYIHQDICIICNNIGVINYRDDKGSPVCLSCYNKYIREKRKCNICGNIDIIVDSNQEICLKCYAKEYTSQPEVIAKRNIHLYKRRNLEEKGNFNKEDWLFIMNENNWKCFYCNIQLSRNNRTIDHIIPISKNGLHIIENIVPCCVSCNSSKNDKMLGDWISGSQLNMIYNKLAEFRPSIIKEMING